MWRALIVTAQLLLNKGDSVNYDLKLEPHYIELVKEKGLVSFVASLINFGNEIGLDGDKVKGVYLNEDGTMEVLCQESE